MKNNVVVTVSLPLEVVNDLYRLARSEGQPVSWIVRQAVEQFVSQKPHSEKVRHTNISERCGVRSR